MASFEQSRETETDSGTSHTVYLPNGSDVSGKRLLLFACVENDGSQDAFTWPDGWSQGSQLNGGTQYLRAGWAYRIVTASEGYDGTDDTVTVQTPSSVRGSFIVARFDDTLDVASYAQAWNAPGSSSTVTFDERDMGSVTTYCWLAFAVWQFARTTSGWPQTNYTSIDELLGGAGNDASLNVAFREHEAQAETPPSFTLSSNTVYRAWTIGMPLTSAGPPPLVGRSTLIDLANKTITVTQGKE